MTSAATAAGISALLSLLGSVWLGSAWATEPAVREAKLKFVPYSSSYLSRKSGNLLKPHKDLDIGITPAYLSPEIRQKISSSSTALRLDMVRAKTLGDLEPIEPYLWETHYSPEDPKWMGHCHQWSSASLHEDINQLLSSTKGIICDDGIILTKGELAELFTGLYDLTGGGMFLGKVTKWENPLTQAETLKLNTQFLIGVDELEPQVFHQKLYSQLEAGRGVVIDRDMGPEVWNQPVFAARSESSEISLRQLAFEDLMSIPWYLVDPKSLTRKEKKILSRLAAIDKELIFEVSMERSNQAVLLSKIQERLTLLSMHADLILGSKMKLYPELKIKAVTTTVQYSVEHPYGSSQPPATASQTYSYYFFEDQQGRIEDSRWSPVSIHPDFMWAPPFHSLKDLARSGESGDYTDVLFEVAELIRRCVDLGEVEAFFADLNAGISDNKVTSGEKGNILGRYERVRKVVNRQKIVNLLGKGSISGLSAGDFGLKNITPRPQGSDDPDETAGPTPAPAATAGAGPG